MPEMKPKQVTPGGATILTSTGVLIDLLDPKPENINLTDISHGLSLECRYGKQSRVFCSVAQHSIHVCQFVRHHYPKDIEAQIWALLHDAAEAYLGDMPTPLKKRMPQYQAAEERMMDIITERFNLPREEPEIVKIADSATLHWEWPECMPEHELIEISPPGIPFTSRWRAQSPFEARADFRDFARSYGLYEL